MITNERKEITVHSPHVQRGRRDPAMYAWNDVMEGGGNDTCSGGGGRGQGNNPAIHPSSLISIPAEEASGGWRVLADN